MNPIDIKQEIEDALCKQLRFMYPFDDVCPNSSIAREIKKLFPVGEEDKSKRHEFVNSAYVEAIPQYKPGRTLAELKAASVLHESTAAAFAKYFGCSAEEATLHQHQDNALVSVNNGENLLVCTGTGSGKTESFLIPVLDAITRERCEMGENYQPGVRAMILYPMNALVNDQVLRIRNILKAAQGFTGIQDITYGIYTGDVATEGSEQNLRELNDQQKVALQGADTVHVDHPYFSDDVVPRTEYTRRSRWNNIQDGGDGPADILITNYSMLERLLLDPKKNSIFSNSWKFIILDEAHTYDGSMGTEISWLLKRLSYRVGGAESLQYLATSATLIESEPEKNNDDKKTNLKQEIYNCFASKIFPCNGRAFSIELGELQDTPATANCPDGKYSEVLSIEPIDISDIVRGLPCHLHPSNASTLFHQYTWIKEVDQRMKRYKYFKENNVNEIMALGDVVVVASIVSDMKPDQVFNLSLTSVKRLLTLLPEYDTVVYKCVEKHFVDLSQDVIFEVEEVLTEENDDNLSLQSQYVTRLGHCIISIFSSYDMSEIDAFNPSALPVRVNNVDDFMPLIESCEKWNILLAEAKQSLIQKWREKLPAGENATVEDCITQYIRSRGELFRLKGYMQNKSHVEYNDLKKETVGRDRDSDFDAFCQLLALSKSDVRNKPLVDLRFHQTVQGLHGMMVCLSSDNGEVSTRLLPNVSGCQTAQNERMYNLGCCQHCGQPYILVYMNKEKPDAITDLTNYKDDAYKYLLALAWDRGQHEDEDDSTLSDNYWLEFKKGRLHKTTHQPQPHDDFIKICHVAFSGKKTENKEHISKCPACGDLMTKGGDYTLIAPYKLSDDQARCLILSSLVQKTDRDPVPVGKPAEGRKVLAFSDSRAMSARVPVTFDDLSQHKLLDFAVLKAIKNKPLATPVSMSPNGDRSSIVSEVVDILKLKHAISLLEREYMVNNALREFPANDVAAQLILETIRTTSSRGLVGRKYIDICSHAHANRTQDADRSWRRFVRKCGEDESLANSIFLELYKFLVRKGQLTCKYMQQDDGRGNSFSLDYSMADNEDSKGLKIFKTQVNNETYQFYFSAPNNNIPPSSRLRKWIDKYDSEKKINDPIGVYDRLLAYLKACGILHVISQRNERNERYVLDASDIMLVRGENERYELMFDDDFFYRIEEHSGQISKELAFKHQCEFSSGYINILSCSTTFEMGVDLGNLNTVFLCNLPPTVANYKQRAGRAGRRAGSSAYVLTFIGSDSAHDSYYCNNPATFLFQRVSPPVIYTDVLSYSAKHMRAEALRDFLKWCADGQQNFSWKRCSSFFAKPLDTNELGLIRNLKDWYIARKDYVLRDCMNIAGTNIGYNPAADLCFQLDGSQFHELNGVNLIELAGPCLKNAENDNWYYWKAPVLVRYSKKCKMLADEEQTRRACLRMGYEDLASYLASMRVLPRYGFPCDTVQLNVEDSDVKLQRDRAIALREYSPGVMVVANKKHYTSISPKSVGQVPNNAVDAHPFQVYECSHCKEIFAQYNGDALCPKCRRNNNRLLHLIVPDYFKGNRVIKKIYKVPRIRECYGGGQTQATNIQGTNLSVATSDTRELLYVNTTWHRVGVDGLMHALRTDIVLWQLQAVGVLQNNEKITDPNAWMSALQAILKAAAEVLRVHSKDISGMISQDQNGNHLMVIYDSSTSGAGSVLKLMPGNREEGIEIKILKRALELCQTGTCCCGQMSPEEGNKKVVRDVELYNEEQDNTNKRLAKACYKCLLSYGNRRHHALLDAYDATVILNALLGAQPAGPNPDGGNHRQGGKKNNPTTGEGKQGLETSHISEDLMREMRKKEYNGKRFMVLHGVNVEELTLEFVTEDDQCLFSDENGETVVVPFEKVVSLA